MKQIQKYIQKKMRYILILLSLVIMIVGGFWYAFLSFKDQSNNNQKDASAAELSINPSSISGLKMWLDSGSGVTVDGSNKVSSWADRSGNGNNLAQATSTKQPVLAANATGNRPALQFDGVDDFLSIPDNASLRTSTQLSLFVVTKNYTTQPNTSAYLSAVSKTDSYSISVANPGPSGNFRLATKQGATVKEFTTSTNTLNNSFSLLSTTYNQPTSTVQMGYNGVLQTVTSSGFNSSLDAGTDFTVGAYSSTVGFLKADISEVLVYNTALPSDSRKQIECYLSAKYGVSAGGVCQFSPKSIDNMKLWVDASNQVSKNTMQSTSDITTASGKWATANVTANGQAGTSLFTGEKAWRFTYSGVANASVNPVENTTNGFTEISPNTSYTFSADLRLNNLNGQNILDGNNGLGIRWYNSSGTVISTENEDKSYTTTWQRFSMTRTSPANAAYAIGIFPSDLANGLSMDYAAPQFEKGSTATSYKPSSFIGGVQLDGFGNVSGWHDLSGSGRNITQTDKTKRPIFQDSVAATNLNKRPNFLFDGVDDLLSGTQITGSRTIFFVRKVGTADSEIFTDTGSGQTLVNTSSTNLDVSSSNQANVAEIIVYGGTLSSAQQLQVQCYLSVKYNINVNSACQFQPSHLAGLATWLRADQGIVTDSSGKVVQWQDQSGNGNSAVQNTILSRPTLLQPGLNGQPSVSLDGTDDFLTIPKSSSLQLTTGGTIFAVYKPGQNSLSVDRSYDIFGQRTSFTSLSLSLYRVGADGTWRAGGSIFNNANNWTYGGLNIASGQFMMSSLSFNNLNGFKIYHNSAQIATFSTSGNNLRYEDSNIGFANIGGTLAYAPIDLSELLVFNQELSDTNRKQVECYLNQKYNLFSSSNCITSLSATVIPGNLFVDSPTSIALSTVQSSTTSQTATATSANIIVQDLTGSAAGWSLTATAKNFYQSSTNTVMPLCTTTNCTTPNFTFKPNAIQVFSGDLGQGLTSANDNTNTQAPTSLTNLTSTGVSQSFTLGSFSSGFGQGKYQKTVTISQNVPPYQRAGSYVGQIIFSVS